MNPYAFLAKLAGIGLAAGTAVAMVKLVEKLWPRTDDPDSTFEYIAVAGEFPPEAEEACTEDCAVEADGAEDKSDGDAGTGAEENTAAPVAAVPDLPNENPVDAPPAVHVTDPLKIADPADFQNWDELGCQG